MELVTPGIGLIFWMTIAFGLVLWVLAKYAWKPIMNAIEERERNIDNALQQAEMAKKEIETFRVNNQELINQARIERDNMLRETVQLKEKIMLEAKEKAAQESEKLIQKTREQLELEKKAVIADLKSQVGKLSIEIAEKLLEREMKDKETHREYLEELIKEVKLN
jgi:F-type H+-transporting ATPase subunit b